MTTMVSTSRPGWVDAAPFRAYLHLLMGVGRLEESDVAALAGLSVRAVEHLLVGRAGRPARRIRRETAGRLLSVTVDEVRGLHWRLVPAHRATVPLARLRHGGADTALIAELTRVSVAELEALGAGTGHCSALTQLRLTAAARRQGRRVASTRARSAA